MLKKKINNRKIDRVPTLEELNEELKKYGNILDENVIRYLQNLLDLEISALRRDILSEEERKILSEISIYRKISIYNIYQRAMDIITQEKERYSINIENNNNDYSGIIVTGLTDKDRPFNIFEFHYNIEHPIVNLYEYIVDQTRRDKEKNRILDNLDVLYREINPYHGKNNLHGEWCSWQIDHDRKVYDLEEQYAFLDKRNDMPLDEQYKAMVQNYFADLFEKDFGICPKKDYLDDSKRKVISDKKSYITKELRCEYPSLTLKKEVKYY